MTKTLLTLSMALLCTSGAVTAQSTNNAHLPASMKAITGGSHNPAKTTATDSRLVATSVSTFDNGNLQIQDSAHLHYGNANYGFDSKTDQWKYDTGSGWEYNGTTLDEAYRGTQSFDMYHRIATSGSEVKDNNNWVPNNHNRYTYDASGNVATYVEAYYDGSGWDSTRYSYTYNANGHVTQQVTEDWSNGSSQWDKNERITYTYNSNGALEITLTESWDQSTSQWQNSSRVTNVYTNNLVTEEIGEHYMGSAWTNSYQVLYTHDANGNVTVMLNNWWSSGSWMPSQRITHTYNSSNDMLTTIREPYVNGNYEFQNRVTYSYNSYHQTLVETDESWNPLTMQFEMQGGNNETRNYYEDYTTAVKDINTVSGSNSVFPIPAQNLLHLRTNMNEVTTATVLLTDVNGRMVKQMQLPAAKQHNTTIDVSSLAPGTYTMSLNAGGTVMTRKVVVQ